MLVLLLLFTMKVLVHGEQNEMGRLKAALIREYEDNQVLKTLKHVPLVCRCAVVIL